MSVEFSPDRRDELCNNLVEVNPDVTGLGVSAFFNSATPSGLISCLPQVVIAMLWHSILIEVITVIMCMLSKGTEHRRYEGYREVCFTKIC